MFKFPPSRDKKDLKIRRKDEEKEKEKEKKTKRKRKRRGRTREGFWNVRFTAPGFLHVQKYD